MGLAPGTVLEESEDGFQVIWANAENPTGAGPLVWLDGPFRMSSNPGGFHVPS